MANSEWSPSADVVPLSGRSQPSYWLAHWWPRVGAVLIDGLVLAPVNIVIVASLHLYTFTHETNANGTSTSQVQVHNVWVPALVYLLYAVVLLSRRGAHNGQTLGKQILGLRVIRNDGEPVDIKTALVREGLVKTLPGIVGGISLLVGVASTSFTLLDYLWPLRDRENRAIHDLVAETHVVQTKQ